MGPRRPRRPSFLAARGGAVLLAAALSGSTLAWAPAADAAFLAGPWQGSFSLHWQQTHRSPDGSFTSTETGTLSATIRVEGTGPARHTAIHVTQQEYETATTFEGDSCSIRMTEPVTWEATGDVQDDHPYGYGLNVDGLDPVSVPVDDSCEGGSSTIALESFDLLRTCDEADESALSYSPVVPLNQPDNGRFTGEKTADCSFSDSSGSKAMTTTATTDLQPGGDLGTADLVAGVAGFGATSRVGEVDMVRASVTNNGPDAAKNVELRFGTPVGTEYGYVRSPGSDWTCSITSKRFILCTAPTLAAGASATLRVGAYADDRTEKTKLAVRVGSATEDPTPGNNTAVGFQKISKAKTPAPPGAKRLAAARAGKVTATARGIDDLLQRAAAHKAATGKDHPWVQVKTNPNLWVRATDVIYQDPMDWDAGQVQGAYSATLWGFEQGRSRVVSIDINVKLRSHGFGQSWYARSWSGACKIPDDNASYWCSMNHQFTIDKQTDKVEWLQGKWKFTRAGLSRNFTYSNSIKRG